MQPCSPPTTAPFTLHGSWRARLQNLLALTDTSLRVPLRRIFRGPLRPTWDLGFETAIHFLRTQSQTALKYPISAARAYQDALVFASPALSQVKVEPVQTPVRGHWYTPHANVHPHRTFLYLHGGGYNYYAKAHANIIALVALAAHARTFALDYRLAPEHPYPAQLDDALAAYCWLLEQGIPPQQIILGGDSAGGNLTLALLLTLRDTHLPLPALAICLAPWTDLENSGDSMTRNAPYDWISKPMADKWAHAYCASADPRHPLLSPLHADLTGLPPLYLQAGDAEILYDMILAFTDRAQAQGANIRLDVWKHMIHDFQAFGDTYPESQDALRRIGDVIEHTLPA